MADLLIAGSHLLPKSNPYATLRRLRGKTVFCKVSMMIVVRDHHTDFRMMITDHDHHGHSLHDGHGP